MTKKVCYIWFALRLLEYYAHSSCGLLLLILQTMYRKHSYVPKGQLVFLHRLPFLGYLVLAHISGNVYEQSMLGSRLLGSRTRDDDVLTLTRIIQSAF